MEKDDDLKQNDFEPKQQIPAGVYQRSDLFTHEFWGEVKNCARCGFHHRQVRWRRFGLLPVTPTNKEPKFFKNATGPRAGYTHWGLCPVMGEPIMMTVSEVTTAEAKDDILDHGQSINGPQS